MRTPALLRPGREQAHPLLDERAQRRRRARPAAPPGDHEQIGHEAVEAGDLVGDAGELAGELRGRVRADAAEIDAQLDGGEGVPHLVGDAGGDAAERGEPVALGELGAEPLLVDLRPRQRAREPGDVIGEIGQLGHGRARHRRVEIAREGLQRGVEHARAALHRDHGADGQPDQEQRRRGERGDDEAPHAEQPGRTHRVGDPGDGSGRRGRGADDDHRIGAVDLAQHRVVGRHGAPGDPGEDLPRAVVEIGSRDLERRRRGDVAAAHARAARAEPAARERRSPRGTAPRARSSPPPGRARSAPRW